MFLQIYGLPFFTLMITTNTMLSLLIIFLSIHGYPLKQKFDTAPIFTRFKALVEKFFQRPIIHLYSDNGGDSMKLFVIFSPFMEFLI